MEAVRSDPVNQNKFLARDYTLMSRESGAGSKDNDILIVIYMTTI